MRSIRAVLVVLAGFSLAPAPALAQDVNPEIANCEELRDPDTAFQAEVCKAHIGCGLVFKIQKACAKAKGFLDKLKDALSFSGRKEVTNNDVFDASAPDFATPDATIRRYANEARAAVQAEAKARTDGSTFDKLESRYAEGRSMYYEGTVRDGVAAGAGVRIQSNGTMVRGEFRKNVLEGKGHVVQADGFMRAGTYVEGEANGPSAAQMASGDTYVGLMEKGKAVGETLVIKPDGRTRKAVYENGKPVAVGPWAPAGQAAQLPTAPAAAGPQPPPAASAVPAPPAGGDLVEIRLASRWPGDSSDLKLMIGTAEYQANVARWKQCSEQRGCRGEKVVVYNARGAQNPFRVISRKYDSKEEPHPSCKFTPSSYYAMPLRLKPGEETCRELLMLAIHEDMEFAARGYERLREWAAVAPVAGTSSGNCKADLAALRTALQAIRKRRPEYKFPHGSLQDSQYAMYVEGQTVRVLEASCKGQPEHEKLPEMRRVAGQTYMSCTLFVTDKSQCSARLPW